MSRRRVGGTLTALAAAIAAWAAPAGADWSGDQRTDVLATDTIGNMFMYRGDGVGGWISGSSDWIGAGWEDFRAIVQPGDWTGDRKLDVIGIRYDGRIFLYRGNGRGGWISGSGESLGAGWEMHRWIVAPGDFDGDGNPDLIGIRPDGDIFLYRGNGIGWWMTGSGEPLGGGWNVHRWVVAPGDFDADGNADLIGIRPDGHIYLYRGNGRGGWMTGSPDPLGGGWDIHEQVASPGDFNGDLAADLFGIRPDGQIFLYRGDGRGGWMTGSAEPQGGGWNPLRILSGPPLVVPRDRSLIKEKSDPTVYYMEDGMRYAIDSPAVAAAAGFDLATTRVFPNGSLADVPQGADITMDDIPGRFEPDPGTASASGSSWKKVDDDSFDFSSEDGKAWAYGSMKWYAGKFPKGYLHRGDFSLDSFVSPVGSVGCIWARVTWGYPVLGSVSLPPGGSVSGASEDQGYYVKCRASGQTAPTSMHLAGIGYAKALLSSGTLRVCSSNSKAEGPRYCSNQKLYWRLG